MDRYNFSTEELEHFKSRGFEILKSSNGGYYIIPTILDTIARRSEAIENAQRLGFVLTPDGKILSYIKK